MKLENKIAVVTGVSKGIGKHVVEQLLEEGCIVYGLGRNNDIKHNRFQFISTDVRSIEEVNRAFDKILSDNNDNIHILINNAGLGYFGTLEELPIEQWQQMFDTNVNGVFYCSRRVITPMKKQGEGHIINISSIAGLDGFPQVSGYCATKFAVKGFSDALYKEVRDYGVKVTCIYPGSVKTDFFNNIDSIEPHDYMLMPEDVAEMIVHSLKTPPNFHQVNLEIRPLMPKGPKQ
jgi:short-subunit dehydrogenase